MQNTAWYKFPIECKHSPTQQHYITMGVCLGKLVYLSCDCLDEVGKVTCEIEQLSDPDAKTCFSAVETLRAAIKTGDVDLLNSLYKNWTDSHAYVLSSLMQDLVTSAKYARTEKYPQYNKYPPRSYAAKKAQLLENYIRRELGAAAPMFHVHPGKEDKRLELRLGTHIIYSCNVDLSNPRKSSWHNKGVFYHSNRSIKHCLFCNVEALNMGGHARGQGHLKRVAEAVNKARYLMTPEGIQGNE